MKNIFKLKRHSHRSHEILPSTVSPSAPSPSPEPTPQPPPGVSASSIPDYPVAAAAAPSSTSSSASEAERPALAPAVEQKDYYSREEEFQVQLAMAISASNSVSDDPDGDQIRAAKLLSLGGQRIDEYRVDGTAELLSRRYWEYNVLDYDERVADGFYDIFGFSGDSAIRGKMPSLVDLQTSIGDLGFEVIVVNRAIDRSLVELEQVAQCYSLDFPKSEVEFLVQRISELVSDHMGGPVRDANDMLTRWTQKSTESRTLQQTSLFPIGCIEVGLSRHRALLFKVLADDVGIPCKLVKGSHYTGLDDDAVNIIKLYGEREYLVDLMADPGTLIPADILSIKDSTTNSDDSRTRENLIQAVDNSQVDLFREEKLYDNQKNGYGTTFSDDKTELDRGAKFAEPTMLPSVSSHDVISSANVGSSYSGNTNLDQSATSKLKGFIGPPVGNDNSRREDLKITLTPQDPLDSRNLFAELNPFQVSGISKDFQQYEATDVKNTGYKKRQEYNAFGATRSQNPLVLKGRSAVNEVHSTNENNFKDGLLARKKMVQSNASSSQISTLTGKAYLKGLNNAKDGISGSQPRVIGSGTPPSSDHDSKGSQSIVTSHEKLLIELKNDFVDSQTDGFQISTFSSAGANVRDDDALHPIVQNDVPGEPGTTAREMPDPKKCSYDRFLGSIMDPIHPEPSKFSLQVRPSSIDPMLDDVGEWEIPWEDLVIGERIGLGSYGEVYCADWNGKEVAVKKFLDQDFYGDALDEFRSEVRIMRRLLHPNVVRFMGAVTRPPNLSIISEFLPRGSLYRILHRPNCQIDEKRRIKMALDVAKGMNCLHTSVPTIVHRDLKSPNLLVDKNWTVKVCDFGLSRLKHSTFLSSKSTAGTPEWMAPEVLRNEKANEKCDVYSFGVILWELASLRMPWAGMNPMQVVGAVGFQDRRLEIPKEVDPLVARIIWECWQKDPSLRPSFAQLTTALKSLQRLIIPNHQELQTTLPQEISVNSTP